MRRTLADEGVKPPYVHIVHPLDGLDRDPKVAYILDVDHERVRMRRVAADGAEHLASLHSIHLEPDLDEVVLWQDYTLKVQNIRGHNFCFDEQKLLRYSWVCNLVYRRIQKRA